MINKILDNYNIKGKLINIKEDNTGNINKTYIITFINNGIEYKYLVQQINTNVFNDPYILMENILGVTNYLKEQIILNNDNNHKVLEIIKTKDNNPMCYIYDDKRIKRYYRIYKYIDNSISYDKSFNKDIVYNTGKAFGNFQKLLNNYPMNSLNETIKDFHDTKKRYDKLIKDINNLSNDRVKEAYQEIEFIIKHQTICDLIIKKLNNNTIPYRVTHNDTKVNNVLMNKETLDYLAVIDLDTVMPGSMLFDYGDGIRSTACTCLEDEHDLTKVKIDLELFESYTRGYLSEISDCITQEELNLMAKSIEIITLELAIRFLNDYINGDTYFKVEYNKQNLYRTKAQLALVKDIETKLDYMDSFIKKCYKQNTNIKKLKNNN
ncbi:MAG: phosphotransferase [Bacilli bacterium]|nr:phosphotransferase [Bacilli bacterium]